MPDGTNPMSSSGVRGATSPVFPQPDEGVKEGSHRGHVFKSLQQAVKANKEGIKTAAGLAAIVVTATAVAVTGPLLIVPVVAGLLVYDAMTNKPSAPSPSAGPTLRGVPTRPDSPVVVQAEKVEDAALPAIEGEIGVQRIAVSDAWERNNRYQETLGNTNFRAKQNETKVNIEEKKQRIETEKIKKQFPNLDVNDEQFKKELDKLFKPTLLTTLLRERDEIHASRTNVQQKLAESTAQLEAFDQAHGVTTKNVDATLFYENRYEYRANNEQILDYEAQKTELKQGLESAQQKVATLEEEIQTLRNAKPKNEEETAAKENQLADKCSQLEAADSDRTQKQSQVQELDQEIHTLESRQAELAGIIQSEENHIDEVKKLRAAQFEVSYAAMRTAANRHEQQQANVLAETRIRQETLHEARRSRTQERANVADRERTAQKSEDNQDARVEATTISPLPSPFPVPSEKGRNDTAFTSSRLAPVAGTHRTMEEVKATREQTKRDLEEFRAIFQRLDREKLAGLEPGLENDADIHLGAAGSQQGNE